MKAEPADLDRRALISALEGWDLAVTSLEYLPVGAGSHHYLARNSGGRRWFITVDELLVKLFGMMGPTFRPWIEVDLDAAFGVLDRAFRTAVGLGQAGLEFVHAPITRPDGEVLVRLDDYAVSVFPFIEGIRVPHGVDRHRLLGTLGRLHAATDALPPGLAQRDLLTVPVKPRFLAALDRLNDPWTHGPYGEPARRLLLERVDAILEFFDRCEELAESVRAADVPWVITHGQVHEANVVRTTDDRLLFVDWDCVAVAPRERDLGTWKNGLDPGNDRDWAAYAPPGPRQELEPAAVELYRLIGLLWGICNDTDLFGSSHVGNGDTQHEWQELQNALSEIDG